MNLHENTLVSALSWDVPLPGNAFGIALKRVIECGCLGERNEEVELPAIPGVLDIDTSPKNGNAMRGKNRNRPIARGKRHLNYNRGSFNHHAGKFLILILWIEECCLQNMSEVYEIE